MRHRFEHLLAKIIIIALLFVIAYIVLFWKESPSSKKDYNCSSFRTQDQASKIFLQHDTDIYQLDRDHDGVPCESLPTGR